MIDTKIIVDISRKDSRFIQDSLVSQKLLLSKECACLTSVEMTQRTPFAVCKYTYPLD
jgi:hypothetical protein